MNVQTDIECRCLEKEISDYLKDAGFQSYMYQIEKYKDREYINVYMSEKGIDFILNDILKSKWKQILEIKKYKIHNICYAIFVFKY